MKLKTAVISVVVSAALVAGVGYGAYYALQGDKSPVEVVPVSNVNTGYWGGMSESVFGSVTSQIAQTVQLNEEYNIDKIYVKAGDEVKEGDPLFSYDMTLQELELEMEQLSLQTQELTMTKLEKDLEKLKKTTATASLESHDRTMTSSSGEEELLDESPAQESPESSGEPDDAAGTEHAEEESGSGQEEGASQTEGTDTPDEGTASENEHVSGEIQIEKVEEMAASSATEQELSVVDSVVSYERLVLAIDALFTSYGEELKAEEIGGAVEEAVTYYRRNLADEKTAPARDDTSGEIREYVIKDSVRAALGEKETEKLETISKKLDEYQTRYVELLIRDTAQAVSEDAAGLSDALKKIQDAYDLLATGQQNAVENMDVWQELRVKEPAASADEDMSEEKEYGSAAPDQGADNGSKETASGTDNEPNGPDAPAGNAPDESDAVTDDETETATEYTLTVLDPARSPEPSVLQYAKGDTVILNAVTNDPTRTFEKWKVDVSQWEDPKEPELLTDWSLPDPPPFEMPAHDLTVEAVYMDNMTGLDEYIDTFVTMAETVLSDGASEILAAEGKDFATELESAVIFYQQWLGELPEEILSTAFSEAQMNQYQLRQNVQQYLTANDKAYMIQQLQDDYRQLCIRYTRALFDRLDPQALVREDLEKADQAYHLLGDEWRILLEQQWQEDQAEHTGKDGEAESEGADAAVQSPAGIGDLLAVYKVYLLLQEYQKMDPDEPEENRLAALQNIQREYRKLTAEQQMLAAQNGELVNTLSQYGLWEEPSTEPETDFGDFGGDSFGDFGDEGIGYTASELREMIEEKEQEIRTCALDIREAELSLEQKKRIVDGKVVKSTLDGTVVSIGTEDGDSEDDYFVKVTNETGLYAKGAMNELALEKLHVGDKVSGMLTSNGLSFTAVIKEISEYPDPNGSSMSWGSENTNASYYPFFAEIEDPEGIEEGEAEIQFSDTLSTGADGIYLEKYFVRTETDGRSYVYMQGEDGKLKKQYITTGKILYSYVVEIISGLEPTDKIAFPYGKNVQEGAKTKEVDALQDAYM